MEASKRIRVLVWTFLLIGVGACADAGRASLSADSRLRTDTPAADCSYAADNECIFKYTRIGVMRSQRSRKITA
jgi:hypothetical protein